MKVFVAGASGAIGTRLVPQLIAAGHDVIGSHNSPANAERLRTLGAKPVMVDLLDPDAVRKAVLENEPDALVHQATALAHAKFSRNMDKVLAMTSELRTKGTDALLAAAREAGVRRFVAQSFASYRHAREGGPIKTEDDPLDVTPPPDFRRAAAAMTYLEQAVTDFGGIALRYGVFYGAANDGLIEPVRKRQYPIIGDGGGITSWIHLEDAAAATALALKHEGPAIYNIVDDEPAPVREWLPVLAKALGAKPPRQLPRLAGAVARRRGGGSNVHRGARRLQRESQAPPRLDAALPQLATRLRRGLRQTVGAVVRAPIPRVRERRPAALRVSMTQSDAR